MMHIADSRRLHLIPFVSGRMLPSVGVHVGKVGIGMAERQFQCLPREQGFATACRIHAARMSVTGHSMPMPIILISPCLYPG